MKLDKITKAPELDRKIDIYQKYTRDGYGAIFVQLNVEDTRNGVAEYVIDKYGDDVIIELKWGQGAKDIGGEIQVKSLEYAKFLAKREYLVDPDPTKKTNQKAFKSGAIKSFAGHSRLGNTDIAGGLAREDHIFKALALGSPYVKTVCMGRAPMIPGFLGSNNEGVFYPERI